MNPTTLLYSLASAYVLCCGSVATGTPAAGYVIQWGWNTPRAKPLPVTVVASNAVAVSAGEFHGLALESNGTVIAFGNFPGGTWGEGASDASRAGTPVKIADQLLTNAIAIAADRDFSLALKKDGSVATWGQNLVPQGLKNIGCIAAEEGMSWVLRRDGTVAGWGTMPSSPGYGQLREVPALRNVVRIAVGPGGYGTRGLALLSDGTLAKWGTESIYRDATPPSGLSNVVAIAVGGGHSLALKSDGTVVGWGYNRIGQATGVPTSSEPYISSGTVTLVGAPITNIGTVAAGAGYSLALKNDGTVVSWGRMVNDLYPASVPAGLSNVIAISAGESFCLAITTNRAVAERFQAK
jgi:trimeric autotransporter adhesin